MSPLVSIIIPCFNSGNYLGETLTSVKSYTGKISYETIIINDGSTDQHTLDLLKQLEKEDCIVLHQENKGPGSARNTGIRAAKGEYILFLDSDNKIRHAYIDKGVDVLQRYSDVGVVYGNLSTFGETTKPEVKVPEFEMQRLLAANFIDMCAMIRRKVWDDIEGFDEDRRVMGFEDWDFWIRASVAGWKFHHVTEILFDYRVRPNSLLKQARGPERYKQMLTYVYSKHLELFVENYRHLFRQNNYYLRDRQMPFRSFVKFMYKKYFAKSQKGAF